MTDKLFQRILITLKLNMDFKFIISNLESAYVERFYSICGNICKNKSGNMSADTIITRSMLKANMAILNKLSVTQLND